MKISPYSLSSPAVQVLAVVSKTVQKTASVSNGIFSLIGSLYVLGIGLGDLWCNKICSKKINAYVIRGVLATASGICGTLVAFDCMGKIKIPYEVNLASSIASSLFILANMVSLTINIIKYRKAIKALACTTGAQHQQAEDAKNLAILQMSNAFGYISAAALAFAVGSSCLTVISLGLIATVIGAIKNTYLFFNHPYPDEPALPGW